MSSGAHAPRRHFNSRPSARGDRDGIPRTGGQKHFNSRPSARGDTGTNHLSIKLSEFQFTPLREGRQ